MSKSSNSAKRDEWTAVIERDGVLARHDFWGRRKHDGYVASIYRNGRYSGVEFGATRDEVIRKAEARKVRAENAPREQVTL